MDVLDEIDSRACIDPVLAADDSVRKYSEILVMLVEEDHDSFLGVDVGGDEDWDMAFGLSSIEGKADFVEAEKDEAVGDEGADYFCTMSVSQRDLQGLRTGHSWIHAGCSYSGHSW